MEPRRQGRICEWDAQRGCGLVAESGSGKRVYLPSQAFGSVQRTPAAGDRITYEIELDEQQRPRAARASFASRRIGRPHRSELWSGTGSHRRHALWLALLATLAIGWWWASLAD